MGVRHLVFWAQLTPPGGGIPDFAGIVGEDTENALSTPEYEVPHRTSLPRSGRPRRPGTMGCGEVEGTRSRAEGTSPDLLKSSLAKACPEGKGPSAELR